VNSSLFTT
jgi:hypothetical protein